ncbi:MAG: glycosyltransferase family 2 protein [Patescibacteria group bacterium]
MNKDPLVSICTTFFNGEPYIYRLLNSCLNQTYKNIEIVIVDDASTDGSEAVIRGYVAKDKRIKYFKNGNRVGVSESFLKMSECAKGDFAMVLGADDWLARDFIEKGVSNLLNHPDVAGVVPKLTSLRDMKDGTFSFLNTVLDTFSPPEKYPREWFLKRIYRPIVLYVSGYALVRRGDLLSAMDYYVKNYYHNPSKSLPEEFRGFFRRALGIDSMLFPEVLTRYKNFVFDSSMNYIKTEHSANQTFDLRQDSLAAIFKDACCYFLIHKYIYQPKWPEYYLGMKIFSVAQALVSSCFYFFSNGMRLSFLNSREGVVWVRRFFEEFSLFEIVAAIIYSIPMSVSRSFGWLKRKLLGRSGHKAKEFLVFTAENFLDSNKNFKVG